MLPFLSTPPVPLHSCLGASPAPALPTPVCSLAPGPRALGRVQALGKSKVAVQEARYLAPRFPGPGRIEGGGRVASRYAGGTFSGSAIIVHLCLLNPEP